MSTEDDNNSRDEFFKEFVLDSCMNQFVVDIYDEGCLEELIDRLRELQTRIEEESDNRTGNNQS
jgi:NADH:ubiquinone oxidoreductase subunit B-like Fe-S oxidoreductase